LNPTHVIRSYYYLGIVYVLCVSTIGLQCVPDRWSVRSHG